MNKSTLLSEIKIGLNEGVITEKDLQRLLTTHSETSSTATENATAHLSAIDVMFYIAGLVLFGAIMALTAQAWDGGAMTRILLTVGVGMTFWAIATYFIESKSKDDIGRGITHALLVAGSLSLSAGGFVIANEFVSYNTFQFYASAATLAVLGLIHLAFCWQIRKDAIGLIGTLLTVAAFPMLVFGLLSEADAPFLTYWLVLAVSSGLLAYASRIIARIGVTSEDMARAFDPLSTFGILGSLYAASFDSETGIIWLLVLLVGIIGLFYLSIVRQNKILLGSGSFFLVVTIITISFRYFSGYSAAASLLISACGLLGTAIVATHINRRYIK